MVEHPHTEGTSRPSMVYEVILEGHLERRWSAWLGDVTITPLDGGHTLLRCRVVDQPALYGLLRKVRDLGLPLLAVIRLQPEWKLTNEVDEEEV